jgi:transposase
LSDTQLDTLDRLRFSTNDIAAFRNPTIVFMSATGYLKPLIARDLGYDIGTVDSARQHYRECGPNDLIPAKPSRRTSRATLQYQPTLRTIIKIAPQHLGYGFSVWSLARLNAHLLKETGIGFNDDQPGQIMKRKGFSFQHLKHTMRRKRNEALF